MKLYWLQLDLHKPLLGEHPQDEWLSELEKLVQTEMKLDDGYQALQWYATQVCSWLKNRNNIEGYDYGSSGLIFETLQEDPHFDSAAEWR